MEFDNCQLLEDIETHYQLPVVHFIWIEQPTGTQIANHNDYIVRDDHVYGRGCLAASTDSQNRG